MVIGIYNLELLLLCKKGYFGGARKSFGFERFLVESIRLFSRAPFGVKHSSNRVKLRSQLLGADDGQGAAGGVGGGTRGGGGEDGLAKLLPSLAEGVCLRVSRAFAQKSAPYC